MKGLFTGFMLFLALSGLLAQKQSFIFQSPAAQRYTCIDKNGTTIIPNGRFITPLGKCFQVAPHPYGLALSPDGNIAVTANSGTSPISITILRQIKSGNPEIQQIPPTSNSDEGVLASVFMGLAISPDNKKIYVAGGQENKVFIFNTVDGSPAGTIDCKYKSNSMDYLHGYIGDMIMTKDGKTLFAVDQIGFRMVVIDLEQQKLIANFPVGRYPFGIALSKDEKTIYVANVGMFQYGYIKKKKNGQWVKANVDIPPFEYGSKEAEAGILNDTLSVPALGPVNSEESFSVFAINIQNRANPRLVKKIKTGILIGEMVEGIPAVGGSSPNSIAVAKNKVFISNGTNDNVTVLNSRSNKIITHIKLQPEEKLGRLRGVIPFGLAASPDEKRIYVAEAGVNAIAVIDVRTLKVLGHIPTAWFPAKIKVTPDGKQLIVTNAKGFGSGPNGGKNFKPGPEGSYIGNLMKGAVQVLDIPADIQLGKLTEQVTKNNFEISPTDAEKFEWRKNNPIPLYPGEKESPIKYIVFISKENRTFDEVYGQKTNVKGDATIARYGNQVTFNNKNNTRWVEKADVMPNHMKLAKEFSISDNFYVDADVSADGHRWLVNTYPNEWVEATTPANYGGNRSYKENSDAPGNLGLNGAAGAIYPEDYNEAGSMWDHMQRNNTTFYNFGFSVMFEPADYKDTYKYGGIKHVANFPLPASLRQHTSFIYPTYNMAIPDQFRVDMFKKEFEEKWLKNNEKMPQMLTVIIPNDHGASERPDAGYPFRESYMADNDLAVGRIVEFLSLTPYWKNMAIFITEDDAQGGIDHIDAHRSLLMVISPYVKKDYVSNTHASFGSIFKTFWNILGIPYLNQYDAGASDLADMFTAIPDYTPYRAIKVDERIFEPQKALDPLDEKFDWEQLNNGPDIDNPEDMIRDSKEQDEWRMDGH